MLVQEYTSFLRIDPMIGSNSQKSLDSGSVYISLCSPTHEKVRFIFFRDKNTHKRRCLKRKLEVSTYLVNGNYI